MKYFMLLVCFALIGCTNPEKTKETLQKSGFTDIKTGSYDWFACGKGDTYSTRFTAKNVNGMDVDGVVCCGLLFKGCTVRF